MCTVSGEKPKVHVFSNDFFLLCLQSPSHNLVLVRRESMTCLFVVVVLKRGGKILISFRLPFSDLIPSCDECEST